MNAPRSNPVARELGLVLWAVSFLTRIPVPTLGVFDPAEFRRSARYFPLVGALVGAAAAAAVLLLSHILPPNLCIALSMALTLVLTGAFHEDGWADCCDAFGGGRTREDILRIMADSRVGAFGAMGIAMMLGTKFLALSSIPFFLLPAVLVAAHALSRSAAVAAMAAGTYARADDGKMRAVAAGSPPVDAVVGLVFGLAPLLLLPSPALWAACVAFVAAALLHAVFHARLGGYTGDCLGAIQQFAEVVFYIAIVALLA